MASPAVVDLNAYQGDRLEVFFRIRNRVWNAQLGAYVAGEYRDLTGLTLKGDLKVTKDDAAAAASFAFTIADQGDPDQKGGFLAYITPAQTAALNGTKYLYDIQASADATHIETLIAGTVYFTKEVTKGG